MARVLPGMSLVTMFKPLRAARSALSGEWAPYHSGGCGFCSGAELHRHVLELVVAAVPVQRVDREGLENEFEPLGIDLLPLFGILPVIGNLERHRAAPEADLEPSAAHVIEHADFFEHPQRMVNRQRVDEGAKAQPLSCAAPIADRKTLGDGAMPSGVK